MSDKIMSVVPQGASGWPCAHERVRSEPWPDGMAPTHFIEGEGAMAVLYRTTCRKCGVTLHEALQQVPY